MTAEVLLYTPLGKWEAAPRQSRGELRLVRIGKSFADVLLYYANICDYVRVLLSLASLLLILHAPHSRLTIAASITANVLLDWLDGPLARHFGQSSIIGCGWDWLADILAQYGLAIWMVRENKRVVINARDTFTDKLNKCTEKIHNCLIGCVFNYLLHKY